MERLTALGTGNALVTKCYNTCFTIENGKGVFLVDTGGGNGIIGQLNKAGASLADIHDLFITHSHSDHILGVVWIIRFIGNLIFAGKYQGNLSIWCHRGLESAIKTLAELTLVKKWADLLGDRIIIRTVDDGEAADIIGNKVTFFDICSDKTPQFGFSMLLSDGKKLTCLGDEPYNPQCERYVSGSHTLLCEAFCLYSERDIFKPYEKHHSTVKDASILAEGLGVRRLILWHTEEKNLEVRKQRYTDEGRKYFSGELFVPDDLDVINL